MPDFWGCSDLPNTPLSDACIDYLCCKHLIGGLYRVATIRCLGPNQAVHVARLTDIDFSYHFSLPRVEGFLQHLPIPCFCIRIKRCHTPGTALHPFFVAVVNWPVEHFSILNNFFLQNYVLF